MNSYQKQNLAYQKAKKNIPVVARMVSVFYYIIISEFVQLFLDLFVCLEDLLVNFRKKNTR